MARTCCHVADDPKPTCRAVKAILSKARLPIPGARLAYYYYVVTKATAAALVRYLRSGTPQTWEKAKGTR